LRDIAECAAERAKIAETVARDKRQFEWLVAGVCLLWMVLAAIGYWIWF
jgi:hypothetical protein